MSDTVKNNLKWLELSAAVGTDELDALVPLFNKYGYGGAIIEEWPDDSGALTYIVKMYLPFNRSLLRKNSFLLKALNSSNPTVRLEEHTLEPGEWLNEWKKYFAPFGMGEKIIIKPGWQVETVQAHGRQIIELDPGMAFGTGLHATTRLTYLGMEKYLTPGMSILDLGTGSGILAIAAAKLGAASVLALDTDPVAVAAATANVVKNKVQDTIEVKKGTLNKTACRRLKDRFDFIVSNITANVIAGLAPWFVKVLKPRARLIVSGISDRELDSVLVAFTVDGMKLEAINSEGEWHAVVAIRPENTKSQNPNSKQHQRAKL
jgi:ribosomal protein L11 methyltransferase